MNWNKTAQLLISRPALNLYVWAILLNMLYNNNTSYRATHGSAHMVHVAGMLGLWLTGIYGTTLFWMPMVIRSKGWRKVLFISGMLAFFALLSWLIGDYSEWLIHAFAGTKKYFYTPFSLVNKTPDMTAADYYLNILMEVLVTVGIFTMGYLMQRFFKEKKQKEEILKKQLETEMAFLRLQINPHFLFNVLNSIYALALKKSDEAPGIILKLSDILRYVLYDSRQEFVPLEKELNMLRDYIEIEKVRLTNKDSIRLAAETPTDGYIIAPMLLIPFVENAIKHGLDSRAEEAYLHLELQVDRGTGMLYFRCSNNYKELSSPVPRAGGIGLENVRKRLGLIYGERHRLEISKSNDTFDVQLEIKLSDHELPYHR